ncbi:MAG: tetratricopeptide repeat protein [Planctomycetes bacterium]|jgi:tetratricopeptide (TPR) repeat protein|nr:tetratricopeptide repeat protein [Planctomycetota bacterium]
MADVSKLFQQAEEAAKRKSYDLAIELFQQILVLDSDAEKARFALREAELGKFEDLGPPSKIGSALANLPHVVKAAFYGWAKKPDLCAIEYERMLARDPRNAKVSFRLGRALEATGQLQSALAVYRGVLLWDPGNYDAAMSAGNAARSLNRLDQALEFFDAARKLNPRDKVATDAHRDVSAMMSMKPRAEAATFRDLVKSAPAPGAKKAEDKADAPPKKEEGIPELRARHERAPSDAGGTAALAKALAAAGKPGEALEVVRKALAAPPAAKEGEIRLLEAQADLLETAASAAPAQGKPTEAARRELADARIRLLQARLEREPTRQDYRFDLGILLFESGDLDGAIASFQQAKKEAKKSRDAAFWLGRAFLEKGKPKLAVNQLESALETGTIVLDPKAKEVLYFLGKARAAAGDPAGARKEYERIYEEDIHFRDVAALLESMGEGDGQGPGGGGKS